MKFLAAFALALSSTACAAAATPADPETPVRVEPPEHTVYVTAVPVAPSPDE